MASQTRPFLTSGVALASAAAVVLATPAVTPALTGSSLSVSSAQYELSTFADVFTVPASEWINAYFQGYGGIIGPNNDFPLEPYATNCNGNCVLVGPSALLYLALDALINGTGGGWDDVDNWPVSAVNYLFEADWSADPGGISAGVLYLLQTSIGSANPLISTAITLAFAGPALVTIVFDNALQLLGDAALGLPLVGAYVYGAINAFLGPASLNEDYQAYFPGVSGVLNWALDVLTGTAPTPPVDGAAAVPAAALAAASTAVEAPVAESTPAAPAAEVGSDPAPVQTPAVVADVPASPAVDAPAADPAESAAPSEVAEAAVADTAPVTAAEVKAETAATEAAPAADAPAKSTAKRPVRDALARIGSSVGSALTGTQAGAATSESAGSESAGASTESADSED